MRQGILLVCCAALATLASAGTASAALVYQKGNAIYSASNSGKSAKLIVPNGRQPGLTPNGQTVVYSDPGKALFAIPAAGGTPVRLAANDCSACSGQPSPDSTAVTFIDVKNNLSVVPLNGAPAVPLASNVYSQAAFSPDSKQVVFDQEAPGDTSQLFTVPAVGGVRPSSGRAMPWRRCGRPRELSRQPSGRWEPNRSTG